MSKMGWISLHRSIQDNPIWHEKPFSKGQAWVDMLLMANHAPKEVLIGNKVVLINRGQFHTSELKLAEKWGWSRNKVRAYLTLLEEQKMSTTKGTTKGTTVTIENYTLYQDLPTTEGTAEKQRKNNEKTSKGTQTIMKNNINNEKQRKSFIPPTSKEVNEYCKEKNYPLIGNDFCNFYESKGWMVGKNKMVSWRSAVGGWVSRTEKDQPPQKNKTREVEIPEGWIL